MLSISLGPVALPVPPLLLLAAVWAASRLASWLVTQQGQGSAHAAGDAMLVASALGLLASRLAYLAMNADLYLGHPLLALDIRDGGWNSPAGVAAGLAWPGWRAAACALRRCVARWPAQRWPGWLLGPWHRLHWGCAAPHPCRRWPSRNSAAAQ
jgi:prolipoprotein diacylglyceryltransferase